MSTNQPEKSADIEEAEHSQNLLPFKTKATAMIKQLENLNQTLTPSQLKEYDDAELSVRLSYIEEVNKSYEMAQSIIEENEISELDGTDRMCFVSLYLDVKSKLTRQLNATRKFDSNPRSSTLRQFSLDESPYSQTSLRKTKVPEIQLPKFVGAYSEWPNFFSLFKTSHEILNLEPYTQYKVTVQVFNPEGLGPETTILVMTDEGVTHRRVAIGLSVDLVLSE
ncbi:uncharacterized protein LOC111684284 [Lucilia cuprina]|uniref:uncharacterized protein LOC111684284 n=1 Tax=Lucilia cuprina TaxID=7375 RepID=UPI001F06FAEE|nr:uncharacterized protein LOC111684284 [Lucilia cuprina]